MLRKFTVMLVLFCAAAAAQRRGVYTVERKSTLAGAAEIITVQLASGAGSDRRVKLLEASAYCSAQCEIALERDGTAATSTALTVVNLKPLDVASQVAAVAAAYRSSDVGAGNAMGRQILTAGQWMTLDLRDIALSAGENFTVRTDSITATVIINIKWEEY